MRKPISIVVLTLLISSVFVSCQEESGTGTLKIMLHCNISKTISAEESALDVVRFTVSGTGPGNKSFCVDTTSSSVTLDGIVLGSWEINAVGYNSDSRKVVSGSSDVVFSQSSQTESLTLNSVEDEGSLQIRFDWDSEITEPVLELKVNSNTGVKLYEKTVNVGNDRSYYTLQLGDIPCGTYLVTAYLFNGESKVTGVCEAFRILSGEKSSGTINLTSDNESYNSDYETLTFTNSSGKELEARIEGIAREVSTAEEHEAELVIEGNYSFDCKVEWYLDGVYSGENETAGISNSLFFNTTNGTHILNAVVYNNSDGSVSSCSWKFTSKPVAKKGVAVFSGEIKSTKTAPVSDSSIIGILEDDRYIIVSPDEGTLQVVSLYANNLIPSISISSSEEGFSWINQATGICSSDKLSLFGATYGESNLRFFRYRNSNNTIETATFEAEPEIYEGSDPTTNVPIGKNTGMRMFADGTTGTFFIFDSERQTILYPYSSDNESITSKGVGLKPDGITELVDFCANKSVVMGIRSLDKNIYYSDFSSGNISVFWQSFESRVEDPEKIILLNKENIIVCGSSMLCKYTKYSSAGWTWTQTLDIDCRLVSLSPDGRFLYAVDEEGNLLTIALSTGRMIKIASSGPYEGIISLSVNESSILALTDKGSILYFAISKEDSL